MRSLSNGPRSQDWKFGDMALDSGMETMEIGWGWGLTFVVRLVGRCHRYLGTDIVQYVAAQFSRETHHTHHTHSNLQNPHCCSMFHQTDSPLRSLPTSHGGNDFKQINNNPHVSFLYRCFEPMLKTAV